MAVGITGAADAHAGAVFSDICNKFGGIAVITVRYAFGGNIAAQGHDRFKPAVTETFQHSADFFLCTRYAGQMGHDFHACNAFDFFGNMDREIGCTAAGAVSDGHKVGAEGRNIQGRLFRRRDGSGCFGREYFKRQGHVFTV